MGQRKIFLVIVLVVMTIFAVYVRAGIERTPEGPAVAGPQTPHSVEGSFANCMLCHAAIAEKHDAMFENYNNCLDCHAVK